MKTLFRKNTILSLFIIFIGILFTFSKVYAYRMVIIRNISNTEKTIYVAMGIMDGITKDMEGTFTTDNISIVAKAVTVTREESVWKIKEKEGRIPFQKNQIVTFNFATEKVWMLDPENYLSDLQFKLDANKRMDAIKHRSLFPHIIHTKASTMQGINETVSVAASSEISTRTGQQFDIGYSYFTKIGFQWQASLRYENEDIHSTSVIVKSQRYYLLGGVSYYFLPFPKFKKTYTYTGLAMGIGQSKSTVGPATIAGPAFVFPSVQLGIEYKMTNEYGLFTEAGFETVNIKERFPTSERQDTTETNMKVSIGFLVYFEGKERQQIY